MRAPFQILAIPYKIENSTPLFCVMHRSDADWWQFIAGGGEDNETPLEAAKREIFEESGIHAEEIRKLTSTFCVPANCISERHRKNWSADTYVLPEYCFAFTCYSKIVLSREHTACKWMTYDEACDVLHWETNKTALYELKCKLKQLKY